MPESSIPSRGSRGTRGGRGSARGRGGKAHAPGKIFWHVSDDAVEPDPANTPPKRKANYVNNTYSLTTSGAFSSRLTYVNADASPKRHRSIANSEWIHTPPTPSDISDEYPWMDPAYDDFMLQVSVNPPKRKRTAGDHPLKMFLSDCPKFLAEFLRLEGRAGCVYNTCPRCNVEEPSVRCIDCVGGAIWCRSCTVEFHAYLPLHRVQEWTGHYFQTKTLKSLGLRVQLGHPVGEKCVNPRKAFGDDFVVLDTHCLHEIGLDYCGCESAQPFVTQLLRYRWFPSTVVDPKTAATFRFLQHFQLLSFESKASVFEYYQTLSRATDNTSVHPPKNRYQALLRMIREWRFLKMLKRAGRGHDPAGIDATKQGECAVLCPACPHPGKNLPEGWEKAPPEVRCLYILFLAIDANFRLQRKKVSNEIADPSLSKGYSYFTEYRDYMAHLLKHGNLPQEKSTCVSHNAVNNAHVETPRGLAVTGAGTIDCARHDIKRPNSVGDLQKGERYVNMDYLFFASLKDSSLHSFVVSYDIACQWSKKIWARMSQYPHSLQVDHTGRQSFVFLVPKFHLPAHIEQCHTSFSFNLTPGVARTDGEAPERGWAHINPVGPSTKEMGPGSRRDTLDDHFGDWNWKKVTGMGVTLLRKMKEAVPNHGDHNLEFIQLTDSLPAESVALWKEAVELWEADNSNENPFVVKVKTVTQVAVRATLAEEEEETLRRGDATLAHDDISPSVLINSGMEIEEQQRRLKADIALLGPHSTHRQRSKIKERSNALRRKIRSWYKVQQLYMPEAAILREKDARAAERVSNSSDGIADINPEDMVLWLPSGIGRKATCSENLQRFEFRLREAQANDALHELRGHLRYTTYLWRFKDRFHRGVGANTRSRTNIQRSQDKVDAAALKYNIARKALVILGGILGETEWALTLRVLRPEDVRGMTEALLGESEGRRTLSWIWRTVGIGENVDKGLHDALRIEWCKCRARAMRWCEEVKLLREEMRRVVAFLLWHANWWEEQGQGWSGLDAEDLEGLAAYAQRQADIRRSLHDHFAHMWRYVDEYIALGVDEVEGEDIDGGVADEVD